MNIFLKLFYLIFQIGPEDNIPFNSVIEYLYNVTYDSK